MKKTLLFVVILVLVAAIAVVGTIAYFTYETPTDVNVMTLGNVEIAQHEQERVDNTQLPTSDNLQDYTQKKPLWPAVYEGSSIDWDPNSVSNQAWKVVESNVAVIDKFVTVENTGKNDAYVRTIFAFEDSVTDAEDLIHVVNNSTNIKDGATWVWEWIDEPVYIDNVKYQLAVATYTVPLAAGETTIPSLKQIYLDKDATQEWAKEHIGDKYDVFAISQAVQTVGFADAATALNEAFYEVTAALHPWLDGRPTVPGTKVSNIDELNASLEDGGNIVLVNDIVIDASDLTSGFASIPVGFAVSVDSDIYLNGHRIIIEDSGVFNAAFCAKNCTLNIYGDGEIVQEGGDDYLIWASTDSTVNIYGGNFSVGGTDCSTLYASGNANINVYGGEFVNNGTDAQGYGNVQNHGLGSITYYGGSYTWHPENDVNFDDAAYINVAEGYAVEFDGAKYHVIEK